MKPILVITGPTACGKTETAIGLAKELQGEVISADSMQVYEEMNLGTAKPSVEEMEGIPHHIMDCLSPSYPFSVADFQDMGNQAILEIRNRDHLPIICGGTGFYINALLKNTEFTDTEADFEFRDELEAYAEKHGADKLHERLAKKDEAGAKAIHPNNIKRVIRAIEYFNQTGEPISEHNKREKERGLYYPAVICKLNMERDKLHERINLRVDRMIEAGLIEEVDELLKVYDGSLTSMQGIGYKEIVDHVEGRSTKDEAIKNMKTNTRQLARRQISWFNNQIPGTWFTYDPEHPEKAQEEILAFYKDENNIIR